MLPRPGPAVLAIVVAAAGLGLILAIVALLQVSVEMVSSTADRIDATRSRESARAAVASALDAMAALVVDNAVWDEAVVKLSLGEVDNDWLYSTWGSVSNDANPYDGTFVLNGDLAPICGYFRDEPVPATVDRAWFGAGFEALIARYGPELLADRQAVSGFTRTAEGPAIVAIGLIRPSSDQVASIPGVHRYLVMTRHLTDDWLADTGRLFGLEELRLDKARRPDATTIPIGADDGALVTQLTWVPRHPGIEAVAMTAPNVAKLTWLVVALVALLTAGSGYALHRLAASERTAHRVALTDSLSGLPNRRALFERLQRIAALPGAQPATVAFIDLDGFKSVNDVHGHEAGDRLIGAVSTGLRGLLPAGAVLARLGGDEFAMLACGADADEAGRRFAADVLALFAKPFDIEQRPIQVNASIGLASADLKRSGISELVRRADTAMYHSKLTGKGRATWFEHAFDGERERRRAVERGIRAGLARGEFDVHYQPIVDAGSGAVTMVEALVRWPRRPEGPMSPGEFIPIAERSRLVHELGSVVLRRACLDILPLDGVRLSVNVSPVQFREPDFEERITAILAETGFPVARLELELTEGHLIEHPETASVMLGRLKAMGISLALDDFGTGYSSVGYLRRYRFDRIKIDRTLIERIETDRAAVAMLAATISIADALAMLVTAEGVENERQAELLRQAGCHDLQGYHFGAPRPIGLLAPVTATDRRERPAADCLSQQPA